MRRALAVLAVLAASSAFAQQNNWSISRVAGVSVMNEVSTLTFRVTNASGSAASIPSFTLGIPQGPYDIDGATAPPGWRASAVDKQNRRVTFRASDACLTRAAGLRPGQSADFQVRVLGSPAAADVTGESLWKSRTEVVDACNTKLSFRPYTGTDTWSRVGLSAQLTTSVRALQVNDQLTLTLTVSNNSTAVQNGIAPAAPIPLGAAGFTLVSGPAPASVPNLAVDGTATFSWVYRATAEGTCTFLVSSATNGTVSSPPATSADLNVGSFPAAVIATPLNVVNNGTVTLQVLPSNNASAPITNVTPLAPTWSSPSGASAAQLSGPTPASVGALPPRATTAFTTSWRVTGQAGAAVTFSGQATAVDASGTTLTSFPVSSATITVQELTLTASPQAVISGSAATTVRYTVSNGSAQAITSVLFLRPDPALFGGQAAGAAPAGWTASVVPNPKGIRFTAGSAASYLQPGTSLSFSMAFTGIGTVPANTPVSHKANVTFADTTTARTEAAVTVVVNRPVPGVVLPIAVATPGRAFFTWSNPSLHDGVLIVRAAGAAPNTAPTPGVRYPVGSTLGNATVVYEDAFSFNTSVADTGLTNGTSYYYRIYNRDEFGLYSPGNVPAPSPGNQLLVIPPGTTTSDPLWCSTVGLPAQQQPYTDLGKAVYQASNGAFITGSVITPGAPVNGNEKWRPTQTRAVVQARPTVLKLSGATEPSIFLGDQQGYAYRLSSSTGAITWTGNGAAPLGEVIQAPAVVAVRQYSSAAFQTKYAGDLVFFGTRNNSSRTSNSVTALDAATGAVAFTYQPGDLDQVTGAPMFDIARDTLWIASLRTGGPSLRVIDLLNPTAAPLLTVSDLGDIPSGVTFAGTSNVALVVDRNGVARGYDVPTRTQRWQANMGGTVTAPLVSWGDDFFASTATGVQRYHVDPTTWTVSPVWPSPVPLRLPTAVRVWAAAGKLFVGDADGYLRRLDAATGALESSVKASTAGGNSMPSLDTTAGLQRVYVGTADGRLCVFPAGFQ